MNPRHTLTPSLTRTLNMDWLDQALTEWRAAHGDPRRLFGPGVQFASQLSQWTSNEALLTAHPLACLDDEAVARAYPLMLAWAPNVVDAAVIHVGGQVRGVLLFDMGASRVYTKWTWAGGQTPVALLPLAMELLRAEYDGGQPSRTVVVPDLATLEVASIDTPDRRLEVREVVPRPALNTAVADATLAVLRQVGAATDRAVWLAADSVLFGHASDPDLGNGDGGADDTDAVAWAEAERTRSTAAGMTRLVPALERPDPATHDPTWVVDRIAFALEAGGPTRFMEVVARPGTSPDEMGSQEWDRVWSSSTKWRPHKESIMDHMSPPPFFAFSEAERHVIQPLWDTIHRFAFGRPAPAGGADVFTAPYFPWANGAATLDLRWTRQLTAEEARVLGDQSQATGAAPARHALYVAHVEHKDAETQPLLVAADMDLLKRTLAAMSRAFSMPVVMPGRFVPGATGQVVLKVKA